MNIAQTPLKFLIVQDSTLSAIELECVLEELGHRVAAAAVTPDAAKAQLQNVHRDIDAVIFDGMQMGLPAYELARDMARLDVPSAVTSDFPEAFVRVLGFEQPYLAKPYRAEDVALYSSLVKPRAAATVAA